MISLYCIVEDINTTLSICNTAQPFADMSAEDQEYLRTIKIKLKFKNNTMYHLEEDDPWMKAKFGDSKNTADTTDTVEATTVTESI